MPPQPQVGPGPTFLDDVSWDEEDMKKRAQAVADSIKNEGPDSNNGEPAPNTPGPHSKSDEPASKNVEPGSKNKETVGQVETSGSRLRWMTLWLSLALVLGVVIGANYAVFPWNASSASAR